jgi:predicted DNA-binding WGR domain protein
MLIYKWINKEKKRFYKIEIKNNTNGIELAYQWGSCVSNRGGNKTIHVCSFDEAYKAITKMVKRRKSRGYELITPLII